MTVKSFDLLGFHGVSIGREGMVGIPNNLFSGAFGIVGGMISGVAGSTLESTVAAASPSTAVLRITEVFVGEVAFATDTTDGRILEGDAEVLGVSKFLSAGAGDCFDLGIVGVDENCLVADNDGLESYSFKCVFSSKGEDYSGVVLICTRS